MNWRLGASGKRRMGVRVGLAAAGVLLVACGSSGNSATGPGNGGPPSLDGGTAGDAASAPSGSDSGTSSGGPSGGGSDASSDASSASDDGGSANADAGSDAAGLITLVDPVAGSENDTTLLGTDSDHNGVRDDIDEYVTALESDGQKRTALVSFARESTAMMLLGGAPTATRSAAVAQATRVGRTIDCLHDLYVTNLPAKQQLLQNLRSALYDNALRLRAYNHASTLVSGTVFRAGHGCDATITGVTP